MFGPKETFGRKNLSSIRILGHKKFGVKKNFGSKRISQTIFLGPKKMWAPKKIVGSKELLLRKKFWV